MSAWANGVTGLGVISGTTTYRPPLTPYRMGGFSMPILAILFICGGGGGTIQAHKAKKVGPLSQGARTLTLL